MSAFLLSAVSTASAKDRWRVDVENGALEGGADNDEVYTCALVHDLAAGVVVRF
jgi:hypothetical protein